MTRPKSNFQPVVLYSLAALIPVLRLHHIVPDAELLQPAVQMEAESARFLTVHDFGRELLLFYHEQQ